MFDRILSIVTEFWDVLADMAPYLLFGFLVAGALAVALPPQSVERHLGGRGLWPILKATLFGIPLPLCSCGVIPVAASLSRHGASRGATTAFLLSTPQTGVDSVLVTFSLLGPLFAVFRPIAAFCVGVLGGSFVSLLDERDAGELRPAAACCHGACCENGGGRSRLMRALAYGLRTLPRDIGKPLVLGLLIAGAIASLVPEDFFSRNLGTGLGAMVAMMALGLPLYVCATASVPIAAALIAKGVSPGAALVFLMTGPATNAAAVTTVWQIMGRRSAIVYLATVALTALAAGAVLDTLFASAGAAARPAETAMLPPWLKTAAAVALLAVLVAAFWPRGLRFLPSRRQTA
jgi:uncharacterized membrane protein YraQ (UPF0718 family)